MKDAHHFQVGDVLVTHPSYKRWDLERGRQYKVIGIDVQQNVLTLRAETGPGVQVDPARLGKKSVYRVEEIEVAIGGRLKWTKNQATLGRRNGQEFEVCEIEDGQMLIRYGSGRTESLSCAELAHLDYALASTTYGAHGKSAERVIGALDRHLGRESFYMSVSRVKHDLRLYASEDLDRLIAWAEQSRAKENPEEGMRIQQGGDQQLSSVQAISRQNSDPSFLTLDGEKQGSPLNKKVEMER